MFLQILSQVNSIIFSLFISHSFFGFKGLFSVSVHFSFDNINITLSYLIECECGNYIFHAARTILTPHSNQKAVFPTSSSHLSFSFPSHNLPLPLPPSLSFVAKLLMLTMSLPSMTGSFLFIEGQMQKVCSVFGVLLPVSSC
ncbi:hypothetical protein B0F90DRAFT_1920830, partial [Multifurca ochricompacta]